MLCMPMVRVLLTCAVVVGVGAVSVCMPLVRVLLTCTIPVGVGAVYANGACVVDMYSSCWCWCCVCQ